MRLISLIILFILAACNSQVADLSPIRMTPVRITTTNEGTFTKMMIYATNADGSFAFAREFSSSAVIEQEVPIGSYKFYGMTFNGFSSERCSKVETSLSGLSNQVTLSFSESTCGDPVFLGSDPDLDIDPDPIGVAFALPRLELCDSVSNISNVNDECSDDLDNPARRHNRGHAMSFRITLSQFEKTKGNLSVSSGLSLGCDNFGYPASTTRGLVNNFILNYLPTGDGATTPFHIRMEFYFKLSCEGEPYVLDLNHGLNSSSSKAKYVLTPGSLGSPPQHKIYLKLGKEEICQGENLTETFATGEGGISNPKIICNESQFLNIHPNTTVLNDYLTNSNHSYKLFTDVDLSDNAVVGSGFNPPWASCVEPGSNFMPIGFTFDGTTCSNTGLGNKHFDGNGHRIKGLRIENSSMLATGLYSMTNTGTSKIQRLNLIDSYISGQGNSGTLIGSATEMKLRDITLNNAVVISPAGNYIGGVAGTMYGGSAKNVQLTNLNLTGNQFVGGLSGQTFNLSSNATSVSNVYVNGNINAVYYVGGVVGVSNTDGIGKAAVISKSRFSGNIVAQQYVGGIAGWSYSTRIENSYAQTNFTSTLANALNMGGIAGYMTDDLAGNYAGVFSSYASLNVTDSCSAGNPVWCLIGEIVGNMDGSFGVENFDTSVFSSTDLLGKTPAVMGSPQNDFTFLLANPGWRKADNTDLMYLFLPSVWEFAAGSPPKLVDEP